jgi:hypothetical protein
MNLPPLRHRKGRWGEGILLVVLGGFQRCHEDWSTLRRLSRVTPGFCRGGSSEVRTPTNESCPAVCCSTWFGLPLMCGVHYFNAGDLSANSLSTATVRSGVGPGGTAAGRDGRPKVRPRGRLASAILSRSLSLPAELTVGDHRISNTVRFRRR